MVVNIIYDYDQLMGKSGDFAFKKCYMQKTISFS